MNLHKTLLAIFGTALLWNINAQITKINGPSLPQVTEYHQSQVLPNGDVLIFGGDNSSVSNFKSYDAAYIYHPNTKQLNTTGPMNTPRWQHLSVLLNNGNVLAISGRDTFDFVNTTEVYNVAIQSWQWAGSLATSHVNGGVVKLDDGRVLVAGGVGAGQTSEIYDAQLDKWTRSSDMNIDHGAYLTLTKLKDGRVLATGGENATQNQDTEIFDPLTNSWQLLTSGLKTKRKGHSALLLQDGRVLIAGSISSNDAAQRSCEIFDPSSQTFTPTFSLLTPSAFGEMALLDNGKVMIVGTGDFTTPQNPKYIQVFDIQAGWKEVNSPNMIGCFGYGLVRLFDGTFLLTGGSFAPLESAVNLSYILTQTDYSACILNKDIAIESVEHCYGKAVNLNFQNGDIQYTYQLLLGSQVVNSFNGSSGAVSIPSQYMAPGKNLLNVRIQKNGCLPLVLAQAITVSLPINNENTPIIEKTKGMNPLCTNDSITLAVKGQANAYLWSNGASTQQLSTTKPGTYQARVRDLDGCLSAVSEPITVLQFAPSMIDVKGVSIICESEKQVQLEALPVGGSWSGDYVNDKGLFSPMGLVPNYYIVYYNYCNSEYLKAVNISKPNKINTKFELYGSTEDTLCVNMNLGITIRDTTRNYNWYRAYLNDVELTDQSDLYGGHSFRFSTGTEKKTFQLTVKATNQRNNVCPIKDSIIFQETFLVHPNPSTNIIVSTKDIVCLRDTIRAKILNPEKGVTYTLSNSELIDPFKSKRSDDGTPIELKDYLGFEGNYYQLIYAYNGLSCSERRIVKSWYVQSFTINSTLNVPPSAYQDSLVPISYATNTDSITWYVDDMPYNKLPDLLSFSQLGKHAYTQVAISKYGCKDTISHKLTCLKPMQNIPLGPCELTNFNVKKTDNETFMDSHVDAFGNMYIVSATADYIYYNTFTFKIQKFDPSGKELWATSPTYTGSGTKAFVTSIDVDANGNVYATGQYTSPILLIGNIRLDKTMNYQRAFIMKLNASGKVEWFINSTPKWSWSDDNSHVCGSDIKCINNDEIVVAIHADIYGGQVMSFKNGVVDTLHNAAIIKIDTKGNFLKKYNILTNTPVQYDFYSYLPLSGGYYMRTYAIYSTEFINTNPTLRILPMNKIQVEGAFRGNLIFGEHQINSSDTTSAFVATLDFNTGWEKAVVLPKADPVYNPKQISLLQNISGTQEYIVAQNTKPYKSMYYDYGSLSYLKRYDADTQKEVWTTNFENLNIVEIHYLKEKNICVLYGHYEDFIRKDEDAEILGIQTRTRGDIVIIQINADNGNLISINPIQSSNMDQALAMLFNDCNDVILLGTSGLNYRTSATLDFEDRRIHIEENSVYFSRVSFGEDGCKSKCIILSSNDAREEEQSVAMAYPNPSDGIVHISNPDGNSMDIYLEDALGKTVLTLSEYKGASLNFEEIPAGLYILKIRSQDHKTLQQKLILK